MNGDTESRIVSLKGRADLPRHVAIIMDGNGRWASKRHLPRLSGHRAGREPVRACVRTCARVGVRYLSLYTFSVENWARPISEVTGLMRFLENVLERELLELDENNVQLNVMGRIGMLPESTRAALERATRRLSSNDGLVLTLALSYGGRAEIIDAVHRVAAEAQAGRIDPDGIDEEMFRRYLYSPDVPDPDLLIRTSGELRVSNFLLWQIAYSEIWVTDVLWPDFTAGHLLDAIESYLQRDRRYGLSD